MLGNLIAGVRSGEGCAAASLGLGHELLLPVVWNQIKTFFCFFNKLRESVKACKLLWSSCVTKQVQMVSSHHNCACAKPLGSSISSTWMALSLLFLLCTLGPLPPSLYFGPSPLSLYFRPSAPSLYFGPPAPSLYFGPSAPVCVLWTPCSFSVLWTSCSFSVLWTLYSFSLLRPSAPFSVL